MKLKTLRGNLAEMSGFAIALLILVIVIGVAGLTSTQFRNSTLALVGGNDTATAVVLVDQAIGGLLTLGTFIGIVVVVGISALLISMVVRAFGGMAGGEIR